MEFASSLRLAFCAIAHVIAQSGKRKLDYHEMESTMINLKFDSKLALQAQTLLAALVDVGTSDEKIMAMFLSSKFRHYLDVQWLAEYHSRKMQSEFNNLENRDELVTLARDLDARQNDVRSARTAADNIVNNTVVSWSGDTVKNHTGLYDIALCNIIAEELKNAVANATASTKEKLAETNIEASKKEAQFITARSELRLALDTAGFAGYSLSVDGILAKIAPDKQPKVATRGKKHTVKLYQNGVLVREFPSQIALTQALADELNFSERERNVWINPAKLEKVLAGKNYSIV
jgi:hypothetical protein